MVRASAKTGVACFFFALLVDAGHEGFELGQLFGS